MNEINEKHNTEDIIDLGAYLKVVMRAKWRIMSFASVVTLLTIMITFTLVPKYIATATLLIEAEQAKAVSFEEIYGLDSNQKEYYLTQFEVIKSDSIAREVIRKLDLKSHTDFIAKPSAFNQLKALIKKELKPYLPINKKEAAIYSSEEQAEREMLSLLGAFKSRLSVSPIRNTQLVRVSFESSDPKLAALVANTVGQVYIDSQMRAKMGITQQASSWLNTRLSQLRIQLDDSEVRLQAYREQQELVDIEGIAGLATQELEQISQQLIVARNEKNNLQSINRVISEYGNNNLELLGSMPEITSHQVIQNVKRDVVIVERKLSELGEVYGPKHPKIISAKAELATVKSNLNKQIKGLVTGIEKELNRITRTVSALERDLVKIRAEYQDITRKETKYNQLKREVETNRNIFNTFLSRSKETEVTSDFSSAAARFTDKAYAPNSPSKPNKKLIIILSFVASFCFAAVMSFVFDALNDTVKTKTDVEDIIAQRMLGLLPHVKTPRKSTLPIHAYLDEKYRRFAESVRTFRTSLLLTQLDRELKVIAITSSTPGEGKTTTSANLAMSLAQMGKVLLIDADLRKPSIAKRFDIPVFHPGLSNLIVGTEHFSECVHVDGQSGVAIMPSGQIPANPLELLSSQRFNEVLEVLKTKYDHIIIDTPPTQAVSDALVIAKSSDSVIYVVKSDVTRIKPIKAGVERLFEAKAHVAGIVLNQVDISKRKDEHSHGYYDYYDYSQKPAQSSS
ncbi:MULTISPECIES: polysaccharide biosynthesis tyrosine autokinase [Pseudoalteromonas]|jgi:capsular exopolysaccharide synthesis family protein|uniref:GumC family protein n=1 Tax=Pseudoalteromonas TaxID=53246 RepID=UPI0002C92E18|nr:MULTISPECIES: polysaccharide biosynthesis tyrosine autokinase [Pseudoalteromonas]MCP4053725.1 polysaccharide biosynthesis tyrosine autokinase [Mesoflavibacter sp.]ENN98690.1 exopolysaccharide biosynthesis protein [Pseudoalteromonas agarivorans S816]MDI3245354.1 polysaccharide biosynthesis tyrosine autokinase [Pseudoalteromonas agarivorans]TMS70482.1 chain-length determining protein [Pseudoalteromonas sp. S1691]TMS72124.1 chain-length determining protein [Pseudoalteromonas sp. S1731]|tara:strand:- start:2942 stop:5155 length:2214 start_codon:yes stop_codon:yes gene_type:complete